MQTPHENRAAAVAEDSNDQMTPAEIIDNARKASYWLFAIAVLALLHNLLISQGFFPVMGLGVNDLLQRYDGGGNAELLLTSMPPLVFVVLGVFSFRLRYLPYITGFILYFLDTLVCVFQDQWVAFGFHIFVLYSLYGGYLRIVNYRSMRRTA